MARLELSCPCASYRDDMRIVCGKTLSYCGHAYFKRCKGWWALTDKAARCPLRKENNHEQTGPDA